jgi:hypothetical protein
MDRYLPIKHPWVSSSEAPIYQVTFPASASDEQLLAYCRAVESWSHQVAHPIAWLMDLSQVRGVSAHQRALFAKYMEGMRAFDERYTKGSALVLPNALLRGVATAIFWLQAPVFEHRTFADCSEGFAWLRTLMQESPSEPTAGASTDRSGGPRDRVTVRPNQS